MSPTTAEASEWTRFFPSEGNSRPDVLHARFVRHAYSRHTHDEYMVGLIETGVLGVTPSQYARHVGFDQPHHVFVVGVPAVGMSDEPSVQDIGTTRSLSREEPGPLGGASGRRAHRLST